MTRLVCLCGNKVDSINDGLAREFIAECPTCLANGGDYKKSSAWQESDRDVSQLQRLGKYKPAALEEKWPSKKQREPADKEEKTQGGQSGREQQTPRSSKKPFGKGRKQHR